MPRDPIIISKKNISKTFPKISGGSLRISAKHPRRRRFQVSEGFKFQTVSVQIFSQDFEQSDPQKNPQSIFSKIFSPDFRKDFLIITRFQRSPDFSRSDQKHQNPPKPFGTS